MGMAGRQQQAEIGRHESLDQRGEGDGDQDELQHRPLAQHQRDALARPPEHKSTHRRDR
ncbi:hypothetical protein D3C72_2280860 [compost metagenome]